jgi:hypothetical protein
VFNSSYEPPPLRGPCRSLPLLNCRLRLPMRWHQGAFGSNAIEFERDEQSSVS